MDMYSWHNDQLKVKNPVLLLFYGPFSAWFVGMIYYLFLGCTGKAPVFASINLKVETSIILWLVLGAYLFAFVLMAVFPKIAAWYGRLTMPAAMCICVALLFPLETETASNLFYGLVFICFFSACTFGTAASSLLSVRTTWTSCIYGMAIGGGILAILTNDLIKIGFQAFLIISVFLTFSLTVFFYLVPATARVPFAGKRDSVKLPELTFGGIAFMIFFFAMLATFGAGFSYRYTNGLSSLFIGCAVLSCLAVFAWVAIKGNAMPTTLVCFMLILGGIVIALNAKDYPLMALAACVLIGLSVAIAGIWMFFTATLFSMYPTRFAAFIGLLINALGVLASYGLIEWFGFKPILYIIYMIIVAILGFVYFLLQKYLMYAFESNTIGSNIKLVGKPFSLPHKVQSTRNPHPFDVLTAQELMVVKLLLEGHTNFSIARNMSIEWALEREYKDSLYKKLGIRFKRQLFKIVAKQPYEF